jgi:uncharacterized protein (TIGR02172 family)
VIDMPAIDIGKLEIIGEGKTAVIYMLDENRVLKLFHEWVEDYLIENEMHAAELAFSYGIPTAQVFGLQEVGPRKGIVYQRLENVNLGHLLTKRPWESRKFGRQMAELHLQIHQIKADASQSHLKTGYAKFISEKTSISAAQKQKVLARLELLPDGNVLSHGDFHPQNILFSNRTPYIIDWTASTAGHPMADVCGTYLIVKTASTHKKLSKYKKRLTETVLDAFLSEYLSVYFERSGFTREDMNAWMPIKAAVYMEVGLPQECEDIFRAILEDETI